MNTNPTDSNPPEPDWSLLPHDPYAFFQLEGDIDTKTLKRAYNKLIRRFKPEKHPAEFQKIRAAYESLSSDIRYGHVTRDAPSFDWSKQQADSKSSQPKEKDVTRSEDASTESPDLNQLDCFDFDELKRQDEEDVLNDQVASPAVEAEEDLDGRLDRETLSFMFSNLESKDERSPRDYYQLAMIVSAIGGENADDRFEQFILSGLRKYPRENGLLNLASDYMKTHAPIRRLPKLLKRLAGIVDPEWFFYRTESAWDRLIRVAKFEPFAKLLAECELLANHQISLNFYLHLMKPAIWKADDQWIDEKMFFLEEHYYSLSSWGQEEFETISSLTAYRAVREQIIAQGPISASIDQAIQSWCLDPGPVADQAVVSCQYMITSRSRQLLEEFGDLQPCPQLTVPWEYIVEDVRNRIGESSIDYESYRDHVINFMTRVKRRTNRGIKYSLGSITILTGVGVAIAALFIGGGFLVKLAFDLTEGKIVYGLLNIVWAFLVLVLGAITAFFVVRLGGKWTRIPYRAVRGELIKLLRVVPVSIKELSTMLASVEGETIDKDNNISDTDEIIADMQNDPAVEIYSVAQRCVTVDAHDLD